MSSTSLDAKGLEAATLKRELDLTINQRLNVNFTDRESGAADHARKSLAMIEKDISSFARFLSQNLCLEVLLFWKEVEQFKTLFTPEERVALFTKIYDLYCVEGAHWQVNFRGAHVETMKKCFKPDGTVDDNLEEEVFDAAQLEVYELMRLDLFPRFNEHLALVSGGGLADEVVAENLSQVLSGTNPPATRSFTRFCRHELCEEALLFWIEANDYSLLFTPMDQLSRAQSIFDTYMSPKAKYKVNVADSKCKAIAEAIQRKEVTNALFVSSQKEVATFIEQDLFPRYETWVKGEGKPRKHGVDDELASLLDEKRLGDRDQMRSALIELINMPAQLEGIRGTARKMDAEEALDFYIDCKKYGLLFTDQDRRETAMRLYTRYVDAKADRLVTIPDEITRQLQEDIVQKQTSDPKVFKKAEADVLNLMTDNIYPAYIKAKAAARESAPAPAAEKPAGGGGGCCIIS